MKIGIFTDCYYPQVNGVVTSVLILEDELRKLGHEVTIVTVKVPNYIETNPNIVRISSIPFSKWNEFRLGLPIVTKAFKKIKALDLDLIHTHTEFSVGLFGKFVAKHLDIPVVHTYHTMYEDYTHYITNFKYTKLVAKKIIISTSKQYVKKYDGIIAPSDKTRFALRSYGVTNNIFVVPTGINLSTFRPLSQDDPELCALYDKHQLNRDDFHILSLGRLSEEKSIDITIQEMPLLLQRIPNAKLLIVGDGPYREKLEELTHRLALDDHVVFIGRIPHDHVNYYYNIADVFVSASKTETQGLTIIEAMAAGLPVIAYDDLNVKDIIYHGETGFVFKTQEELNHCLIECYHNPELSSRIIENATATVSLLSKENFGKNAEKVYKELVYAH